MINYVIFYKMVFYWNSNSNTILRTKVKLIGSYNTPAIGYNIHIFISYYKIAKKHHIVFRTVCSYKVLKHFLKIFISIIIYALFM